MIKETEAGMKVERLMRTVKTVSKADPLAKPLAHLREQGFALLVDENKRPIGIITLFDMHRVKTCVEQLLNERPMDVVKLFGPIPLGAVKTVRVDDSLVDAAEKLVNENLSTGVPAVDEDGVLAGYVFAKELRDKLRDYISHREKELKIEVEQLKKRYPEHATKFKALE